MSLKKFLKKIVPWVDCGEKVFFLYKKSNKAYKNNHLLLAKYYQNIIYKKYKCIISCQAKIEGQLILPHPLAIVIGNNVQIGNNVTIYQNVTLGQKNDQYPIVGNNVIIYPGSVLVGNIKIGDNSIIGANSVVLDDVTSNTIVAGVPAKKIGINNEK